MPGLEFSSRYNAYNTTIAAEPGRYGGVEALPPICSQSSDPVARPDAAVQEPVSPVASCQQITLHGSDPHL